jgi:hypothetical protein
MLKWERQRSRNRVAAPAREPHRAEQDHVLELHRVQFLAVVPETVVEELPDKFDRRLCPELLLLGHVEVVDEDDALLADGRAQSPLGPTVHL